MTGMLRGSAWSLGVGVGLFAFLFLPELLQGRIFAYRDAAYYHLPISRVVSEELRHGRFPFWNPGIACGTPLAANPNNYAWYPSRLLELVASPETALSIHFFAHWILGGAAMAALAAALGASTLAAATAAALYLLCGPSLSLLSFANLVPFLFWTPAALLAALALIRSPGRRPCAALAACLAAQTTFVEPSFLAAEALAAAALVLAVARRPLPRSAPVWAATAAVTALLLAAPMWVPMAKHVAASARGEDVKASLGSSVSPIGLLQIPVPQLLGEYHTLEKRTYWGEILNEGKGPFFLSLSFGVVVLAGVAAGVAGRARVAVPLAAAAVLGVLLAMGAHFAPFRSLALAEGGGWFRWPVKFTFLAAVTLPPVVALGVDALRGGSRAAAAAAVGAAVLLGAGALAMAATGDASGRGWLGSLVAALGEVKDVPEILGDARVRMLRASTFALGAALAAGAVMVTKRAAVRHAAAAVLAALVVFELAGPQRSVNRATPLEVLRADGPILQEARAVARRGFRVLFPREHWDVAVRRAPDMPDEWWPRTRLDREIGNFYHAVGEGIPGVLLNPDRLVAPLAAEQGRVFPLLRPADQVAMLELLGVGASVKIGASALVSGKTPHATSVGYPAVLVEQQDAVPIASWVDELPVSDAAPWSPEFVRAAREQVRAHGDAARVRVVAAGPGRWTLDVSGDRGGWVTLSETADDAWQARVDGRLVPIEPYLSGFQAVSVPAGSHRVEWTYRPTALGALLAASALGWIAVLALALQLPVLVYRRAPR
ncbi:MAG: hypothetical protein ACT4PE_01855 [Candidatus Eiseniibacteriota bacterium]